MPTPQQQSAQIGAEQEKRIRAVVEEYLRSKTGVVAGTYTNPTITLGADGRTLSASSGSGSRFLARCKTSSDRTIPAGGLSTINFDTKLEDPDNLVTTGAWNFTAPMTATYYINFHGYVKPDGTQWLAKDACDLLVYKNNSVDGTLTGPAIMNIVAQAAAGSPLIPLWGAINYPLAAGDLFKYRFENLSSGATQFALQAGAYIEIAMWGA